MGLFIWRDIRVTDDSCLRLEGGALGSTATVRVSFEEDLDEGMSWWKFGLTLAKPTAHWYEFSGASMGSNSVTLTITDGGEGDDDGEVNGVISDPGGIGRLLSGASSHSVPVAPLWLLWILSALMLHLGAKRIR